MSTKTKKNAPVEEVTVPVATEETISGNTDIVIDSPVEDSPETEPESPKQLTDSELIEQNPNAEIRSLRGPQAWQDKDYILLDGIWRWIPHSKAWDFIKTKNTNARGDKNYVSAADINPLGKQLEL